MKDLLEKLTFNKNDLISNLRSNLLFFISAIALVILNTQDKSIVICQLISIILIFLTIIQIKNIFEKTKSASKILKILSGISTIGIAYYTRSRFFNNILEFNFITRYLDSHLIERGLFADKIGYILMLASMFCIYTLIVLLFNYLSKIYKDILKNTSKGEKISYFIIAIFLILAVIVVYNNTSIFYGKVYKADALYSCDTGSIVSANAYLNVFHDENDVRQPLFAFFAMPFIGIFYTISLAFPFSNFVWPILLDVAQVLMLLFSNFIIAKLLKLDSKGRILFVILTMCTYMNFMYTFIMEQYVIAYFWLITCIYAICNQKQDEFIISAAGGAIITNLFLSLWIPKEFSLKKIKKYIFDLIKIGIVFLYFILIFGRMDILVPKTLEDKTTLFVKFMTTEELTFENKLEQYSEYIKNCFLTPSVEIRASNFCPVSIQLRQIDSFNFIGIAIFILSLIGFIVSRKEKLSQIAFSWVIFSTIILGILGWGAAENAMILYSLYFGWAFLVLLYQLVKWVCSKTKFKYSLYIATILIIIILMIFNYQGVKELLEFAIINHPVVWI